MNNKIELLAPGGDIDAIKAAILAGADAIYCGLDKFNARNRATNIGLEKLPGILHLAHQYNCEVFITLNILVTESEIPAFVSLLNKLIKTNIDGVIIQDIGMFYLISKYFKSLIIHASTQMTTHNVGQISFLAKLNAQRVNLSRELKLDEIKELTTFGKQQGVLTEVFVHGSNCISFSGLCYISSVLCGNSGNRGRCSQPCRSRYLSQQTKYNYPLNLKDNSAFSNIKELADAGVASLKIEGRIKQYDYIYSVVKTYNEQLNRYRNGEPLNHDKSALYKVFNRDFSNGFLKGTLGDHLFIDNPRDNSIQHLSIANGYKDAEQLDKAHLALYKDKETFKLKIKNKINQLNVEKVPLVVHLSGNCGELLRIRLNGADVDVVITSDVKLSDKGTEPLSESVVMGRLKAIDDTAYCVKKLDLSQLDNQLYLPFKELTALKNKILEKLNGQCYLSNKVEVPLLKRNIKTVESTSLQVLISSPSEIEYCTSQSSTVFYQLPNSLHAEYSSLIELFNNNTHLIPWFPSVLIGDDYVAAVLLIKELKPKCIVANNTGIAYEAFNTGASWIAGPYMNITNSYSMLALQKELDCKGAFVSNELSKQQIRSIKKPSDFQLFYSIYHPITLMTSRQCLFHRVTGCKKLLQDGTCIQQCEKSSSITDANQRKLVVNKSKGYYHEVYNSYNFLNMAIVNDIPNFFDAYCIDMRNINTQTELSIEKSELVKYFIDLLCNKPDVSKRIEDVITSFTSTQYKKGI